VADTSLATTPVAAPTQAPPAGVAPTIPTAVLPATPTAPNLTPPPPPKPVAPAAGTYFGQVTAVDVPARTVTFAAVCLGADRRSMSELAPKDKEPHVIPLLSTTEVTVFTSPPNNPAAGRMITVDLPQMVDIAKSFPNAKYFLIVEPQGVKTLEQDSGVRPSTQRDDPCPHF
jgi:hypothetical protein